MAAAPLFPSAQVNRLPGLLSGEELIFHCLRFLSQGFVGSRTITKACLKGTNKIAVTAQTRHLGPGNMIIDADCVIIAATDNPSAVKFNARDTFLVAHQSLQTGTIANAPDLDQAITRRGHDLIAVDLHRIDRSSVSFYGHKQ